MVCQSGKDIAEVLAIPYQSFLTASVTQKYRIVKHLKEIVYLSGEFKRGVALSWTS